MTDKATSVQRCVDWGRIVVMDPTPPETLIEMHQHRVEVLPGHKPYS